MIQDTNPKTKPMTDNLLAHKWRAVYDDGTFIEQVDGKDQNSQIQWGKVKSMLIIRPDGTEALKVDATPTHIPIYKMRTIQNRNGVEKIKLIALVNRKNVSDQTLYFLFRDGTKDVIDAPDEFRRFARVNNFTPSEKAFLGV